MKTILAIDDNEINLQLLGNIIRLHYPGYRFIKANNGIMGISKAKKELPEIILLDILMPGLNGYEVCDILKKEKSTSHIPVLMISALGSNPAERTKGLNAGADAFVSKPFTVSELQAQINVVLRIKNVEDILRKRNENLERSIKIETHNYLLKEERIQQISENARQFYWEVDNQGEFVYVSPVIESILKTKPLEIIGKMNFAGLFKTDEKNTTVLLSGQSGFKELEIELKVGNTKRWFEINCFPFTGKDGKYFGTRGICFDITKRKNAELARVRKMKQIQQYQKKLRELNNKITLVEELERRRIAENLHDSLGQTLSLAYLKLSAIETNGFHPKTEKALTEIFGLLNKAINESRQITYDLSPPVLHELGLISALKWRLEQIEQTHQVETKFIGENINIQLKKENTIFIYRIINELLQNVLKHANATEIKLEVEQRRYKFRISVADNGIGLKNNFDNSENKTGNYGLLSIKERLQSFNGRLILKSEQGVFTLVTIEIPIKNN
ncbi:MAG: response regulator [Prolixibacteraceae bacterium]|nr:MAG: response regulator [Prolixibacteraceae bacterium]